MAGFHYCCRRLLMYSTSRLNNRDGIILLPNRRNHHMYFRISLPEARTVFQKSKLLLPKDKQHLYRLASTSINIPNESVSDVPKSGTLNTTQSNNVAGVEASNSNVIDENLLPPAPVGEITEPPVLEFVYTGLKEPSFESLGLGSWWPPGIIQQILEYLHINCELPWWQAVVVVTVISRIILFPVNLSVRKDTVNLTNHIPAISKFQEKITESKRTGDFYSVAAATQDMQNYIKENKVNMFAFLKTMFIQGPVFLSMFYGLKGMANTPVESLKTGGLFWFSDLTAPDPYYILPLALSSTLLLIIEVGAEGSPAKASSHNLKWIMRVVPLVVFAVSTKFSACITWYWTVSNIVLLGQVGLMKIPAVARYFKIPKPIKHEPGKQAMSNKGFIEGFKEGFANAKISSQMEDRQRLNLIEFQRAGTSAIPRTFKRNPLLEKEKK